jgi:hypothetical protein
MEVLHDSTLPVARRADDGVDDCDQRPVDGVDQLENRLSVVIAKDPVFMLEDHDVAALQVAGGSPDADRAVGIDLHPDLPEGRGGGAAVDETYQIDLELGCHLTERGDES